MNISSLVRWALGAGAALGILAGCSSGASSAFAPSAPGSSSSVLVHGSADVRLPDTGDVLYTFQGGTDGADPWAGLLAEDGEFYGTTFGGGTSDNDGTVFKMSPSGAKSVLYIFHGGTDGARPLTGLTAGNGGVLYGATLRGGGGSLCRIGCGTVYELVPSGSSYTEKVIYAFQGGNDGAAPIGALLIDKSGALYGTTTAGGGSPSCTNTYDGNGCGTVFKLTPSGSGYTERVLYGFQAGNDGIGPAGSLIADGTGALYGTTEYGGGSNCSTGASAGCGTVFKLTPSGSVYTETVLHRFQAGSDDGAFPRSALVAGGAGFEPGSLYGTTTAGGANGLGTVYELTPSGSGYTERLFYTFDASHGASPSDDNGLYVGKCDARPFAATCLYGTTIFGGTDRCLCGTVFKLTAAGNEAVLHSFRGGRAADGSRPRGSLVADAAGSLYGTTSAGGTSQNGIVFKVSP